VAKLVRVVFEPTRRGRTELAEGKPTRL